MFNMLKKNSHKEPSIDREAQERRTREQIKSTIEREMSNELKKLARIRAVSSQMYDLLPQYQALLRDAGYPRSAEWLKKQYNRIMHSTREILEEENDNQGT